MSVCVHVRGREIVFVYGNYKDNELWTSSGHERTTKEKLWDLGSSSVNMSTAWPEKMEKEDESWMS